MSFITFKINKTKDERRETKEKKGKKGKKGARAKEIAEQHFNESITMIGFCWQLDSLGSTKMSPA